MQSLLSCYEAAVPEKEYKLPSNAGRGWVGTHKQMRLQAGLSSEQLHPKRVGDLVALAEQLNIQKEANRQTCFDVKCLYTDVSQSAARTPWTRDGIRSITTNSEIYCHRLRRLITVSEMFAIFGFDRPDISTLSTSKAKDLLGECMTLPCITVVLFSVITVFNAMKHNPDERAELYARRETWETTDV